MKATTKQQYLAKFEKRRRKAKPPARKGVLAETPMTYDILPIPEEVRLPKRERTADQHDAAMGRAIAKRNRKALVRMFLNLPMHMRQRIADRAKADRRIGTGA